MFVNFSHLLIRWLLLIFHIFIACCCSSSDWVKCTNMQNDACEVLNVLDVTHPYHWICFKVNASNPFDDVTSNETCVYLHNISKCSVLPCCIQLYCYLLFILITSLFTEVKWRASFCLWILLLHSAVQRCGICCHSFVTFLRFVSKVIWCITSDLSWPSRWFQLCHIWIKL